MNKKILAAAGALAVAGCAMMQPEPQVSTAQALEVMKASFLERGQAKMDRLNQDDVQRLCSESENKPLAKDVAANLEKAQLQTIQYPSGSLMGDYKAGERIAQSGVGKQYTDDPSVVAGGNCYACHQLSKAELAFGTIGPSLYNFGKLRGFTPEMQRYAFAKIYNPEAFSACSSMPRFGHNHILTEQQIKDLVALLMDPQSPVNQ